MTAIEKIDEYFFGQREREETTNPPLMKRKDGKTTTVRTERERERGRLIATLSQDVTYVLAVRRLGNDG